MKKQSAGILLYRSSPKGFEVFLVHPGGPFWAKKDIAAWSIPKGEFIPEEEAFAAAKREFREEVGADVPQGKAIELGQFKVSSSKIVHAWAVEADFDTKQVKSNAFELEWPPKSGQTRTFPEVDKAGWFSLGRAQVKIVKGQVPVLEQLAAKLGVAFPAADGSAASAELSAKKTGSLREGQTSLF